MHTGKQKQMNASYQASLVNRHIRRFTGYSGTQSISIYVYEYFYGKDNQPFWSILFTKVYVKNAVTYLLNYSRTY